MLASRTDVRVPIQPEAYYLDWVENFVSPAQRPPGNQLLGYVLACFAGGGHHNRAMRTLPGAEKLEAGTRTAVGLPPKAHSPAAAHSWTTGDLLFRVACIAFFHIYSILIIDRQGYHVTTNSKKVRKLFVLLAPS
jgi:hypothetical protein